MCSARLLAGCSKSHRPPWIGYRGFAGVIVQNIVCEAKTRTSPGCLRLDQPNQQASPAVKQVSSKYKSWKVNLHNHCRYTHLQTILTRSLVRIHKSISQTTTKPQAGLPSGKALHRWLLPREIQTKDEPQQHAPPNRIINKLSRLS
jgi:hypothetical protein